MLSKFAVRRRTLAVAVISAAVLLAGCGGGSETKAKVATLSSSGTTTTTTIATAQSTQEAWLAFASCMRDNGVDMKDPTFDANGDVQGGFGPDSGVDFRDETVRAAIDGPCQQYMDKIRPGGAGGRGFDRTQIEAALTAFTTCLRDNGLQVDDITFGGPGERGPNGTGGDSGGTAPSGPPPSGFSGGTRPDGPPNGQGFNPTDRIIERLGLDKTDPAVAKALTACQPALEAAFTPTTSTTQAGS